MKTYDYFEAWLKEADCRYSLHTMQEYSKNLREFPYQDMLIQDVTSKHIRDYLSKCTPVGALKRRKVLVAAFKDAIRDGYITRNPADIRLKKLPAAPKTLRVWSQEELKRFLAAQPPAIFKVACFTGMRLGELLALTWQDVNLRDGEIHVHQQLAELKGRALCATKTLSSVRRIPIPQECVQYLTWIRPPDLDEKALHNLDRPVFCTEHGTPYWRSHVREMFKRWCNWAGVPVIRIHDIRHTYATLLYNKGTDIKVIQELLGHANYVTTANVYMHADKKRRIAAVEAMLC